MIATAVVALPRLDQIPDAGLCERLTDGQVASVIVGASCTGCTVELPDAVGDQDVDSAAIVTIPMGTGSDGLSFRVKANGGTVLNSNVGVAKILEPPTVINQKFGLRTYLNGAVQESFIVSGAFGTRPSQPVVTSNQLVKAFDELEYFFSTDATEAMEMKVFEICTQ